MILAETNRLLIRPLEKSDLPALVEIINDWDVVRWVAVVPYPYALKDAEDFYKDMNALDQQGRSQYFAVVGKGDRRYMGGIGLHPSRAPHPEPGEIVLGYWLGRPFWGVGFMSEAVNAVIKLAFQSRDVSVITANTDPNNLASQAVLEKTGFTSLGLFERDYPSLHGGKVITKWQLTRQDVHHFEGLR